MKILPVTYGANIQRKTKNSKQQNLNFTAKLSKSQNVEEDAKKIIDFAYTEEIPFNKKFFGVIDFKKNSAALKREREQFEDNVRTTLRYYKSVSAGCKLLESEPSKDKYRVPISEFIFNKDKTYWTYPYYCPVAISAIHEPNPLKICGEKELQRRKELTAKGLKGYLTAEDFQWQFDPKTQVVSIWEIDPTVFSTKDSRAAEIDNFVTATMHIPEDIFKNCVLKARIFGLTREENSNFTRVSTYRLMYSRGEMQKEMDKTLKDLSTLQQKFLDGNGELAIQKQEVEARVFDAFKLQDENPYAVVSEVPNGILIFGKSKASKEEMRAWIKKHENVRHKVEKGQEDPMATINSLIEALKEAESYYQTTGKRTIIELDNYDNFLTDYSTPKNRLAIGRFKGTIENAAKNYHATVLYMPKRPINSFEPSTIGGQRFNIKIRLDNDSLTEEDRKRLDECKEKIQFYQDAKYGLQEYCTKRSFTTNDSSFDLEDAELVYEALNKGYKFTAPRFDRSSSQTVGVKRYITKEQEEYEQRMDDAFDKAHPEIVEERKRKEEEAREFERMLNERGKGNPLFDQNEPWWDL